MRTTSKKGSGYGVCATCEHFVSHMPDCRLAEYKKNPLYSDGLSGYAGAWENRVEITSCEKHALKYKKRVASTELNIICNKLLDLGYFVEYTERSSLEDGSYLEYSIYEIVNNKCISKGCDKEFIKLQNFLKEVQ
jgi:hypothetical protein